MTKNTASAYFGPWARDGGRKVLKHRRQVVDTNDNDPVFEDGTAKEIPFDENEPPGSKVYKVKATDADSGENGYISYSLVTVSSNSFAPSPTRRSIKLMCLSLASV
jgi:hypothetical protein